MTTQAIEREVKLDVPDAWTLPDLAGVGGSAEVADAGVHHLVAVYYDTADHRLLAGRATLRRRTGGTDPGWHLKLPAGGPDGTDRLEVRHDHKRPPRSVPADLVALARSRTRGAGLAPVVELATVRHAHHLRAPDGSVLVEVVLDEVAARVPGEPAKAWREVEVELAGGDVDVLDAVVDALLASGATRAAGPSKLGRALGRPRASRAPVENPPSTAGLVLAYLRAQVDALVDNDTRVRLDTADGVHDMRVATRRLRSTLATHRRRFDPDLVAHLRAELKHLGTVLGEARDAEVLGARLLGDLAALAELTDAGTARWVGEHVDAGTARWVGEHVDAAWSRARAALLAELDSDRYLALLDALEALVAGPALPGRPAEAPEPRGARGSVRHDLRRVRRAMREARAARGTADAAVALHRVRKAAKRARYAAEAVAPRVGARAERFALRMETVQDLLGAHQDDVVLRARLRELAGVGEAHSAFLLGALHERAESSDEVAYLAARRALRGAARHWPS
ncbi:MAG: CYTH and CHAD domain-containing protein [Actinomycetales bacterium]|nr:CYTH and CHAD domain-containing protein [Actinomycetales bacterium]